MGGTGRNGMNTSHATLVFVDFGNISPHSCLHNVIQVARKLIGIVHGDSAETRLTREFRARCRSSGASCCSDRRMTGQYLCELKMRSACTWRRKWGASVFQRVDLATYQALQTGASALTLQFLKTSTSNTRISASNPLVLHAPTTKQFRWFCYVQARSGLW